MTCPERDCQRDAGHPLPHRHGLRTWAYADPTVPEWRRRADALRAARGLVAVKELR